jgi:peptide/nickel transport system substrate-binding protein
MSWTFKLRKGVKFHDGEPFNAKVIEWWLPKFKGTENAYMTEAIDKIVVVDELHRPAAAEEPRPGAAVQHGHQLHGHALAQVL